MTTKLQGEAAHRLVGSKIQCYDPLCPTKISPRITYTHDDQWQLHYICNWGAEHWTYGTLDSLLRYGARLFLGRKFKKITNFKRECYHLFHHIWCNNFINPDIGNCSFCNPPEDKGLWEKYPYDPYEEGGMNLHSKHFPDAIARK